MDQRIDQLRQQLREDPSSRQFYQLGELLRREGALDESVSVLRAGLGHHPRYVAPWVALGRALLAKAELAPAEEAFWHALELDPENAVAARGAGEAAMSRGDWLAAIRSLKLAKVLSPGDPVVAEKIAQVEQQLAARGELKGGVVPKAEPSAPPEEPVPAAAEVAVEPAPEAASEEPTEPQFARDKAPATVPPAPVEPPAEPRLLTTQPLALPVGHGATPEAAGQAELPATPEPAPVAEPESLPVEPPAEPSVDEAPAPASEPAATESFAEPEPVAHVLVMAGDEVASPALEVAEPAEVPVMPEPEPYPDVASAEEAEVLAARPAATAEPTAMPASEPAFEASEPAFDAAPEPAFGQAPEPAFEAVSESAFEPEPEPMAVAAAAIAEVGVDTQPAVSPLSAEPSAAGVDPFALDAAPPTTAVAESDPFAAEPTGNAGAWPTGDDVFGGEPPTGEAEAWPAAEEASAAFAAEPPVAPAPVEAVSVPLELAMPEPEPVVAVESAVAPEPHRDMAELPLPTLTLARLALAQGDRDLAERTLESLLERDTGSAEAHQLLAQLRGEVEPGAVSAAELAQKKIAVLEGWLQGLHQARGRGA